MMRETATQSGTLPAGTVLLRLFVLCSPLLLNDLYLPLVPGDAHRLNLVLDVLVYIAWQSTVIYLAFQARWFSVGDLGITSEDLPRQVLWGIMLLILVLLLYVMLLFALKYAERLFHTGLSFTWYFPLPDWKPVPVFFYVLYLSITAGVYEEIVYRGMVISLLRRVTSRRWALVLGSALIFTAIHWSNGPQTWAEAFVFGSLWAFLFIRRGRLIPIMIAHFLYDFIGIYRFDEPVLKLLGLR